MAKKPASKFKAVYIGAHIPPETKGKLERRATHERRSVSSLIAMLLIQGTANDQ